VFRLFRTRAIRAATTLLEIAHLSASERTPKPACWRGRGRRDRRRRIAAQSGHPPCRPVNRPRAPCPGSEEAATPHSRGWMIATGRRVATQAADSRSSDTGGRMVLPAEVAQQRATRAAEQRGAGRPGRCWREKVGWARMEMVSAPVALMRSTRRCLSTGTWRTTLSMLTTAHLSPETHVVLLGSGPNCRFQ